MILVPASCAPLSEIDFQLPRRAVRHRNPGNDAPFGCLPFEIGQLRPENEVRHALDDLDIDAAGKQAGHHLTLGKRRVRSSIARAWFQ